MGVVSFAVSYGIQVEATRLQVNFLETTEWSQRKDNTIVAKERHLCGCHRGSCFVGDSRELAEFDKATGCACSVSGTDRCIFDSALH